MSSDNRLTRLQEMFKAMEEERQQKQSANEVLRELYVNDYGSNMVFGVDASARTSMARELHAEDCRACWHVFDKYIDQVEAEAFARGVEAATKK